MRPVDLEALVAHRLQKSEEALQAARVMIDQKMFSFAMNRVYYSVYYAVQALLAHKEVAFSKHGQVKGYFNREFIKQEYFQRKSEGFTTKRLNIDKRRKQRRPG